MDIALICPSMSYRSLCWCKQQFELDPLIGPVWCSSSQTREHGSGCRSWIRAADIKRLYDFDYKDFIALMGVNDVFSHEEFDDAINQIRASRSWRLTRPPQYSARLIRNLEGHQRAAGK